MEPSLSSAALRRKGYFAQFEHNSFKTKPALPVVQI
jgi:hypothetical protein